MAMQHQYLYRALICVSLLSSCAEHKEETALPAQTVPETRQEAADSADPLIDYNLLRHKITYSQASLAEVNTALTARDKQSLTNIVHALYSMRWLRGVQYVLDDVWTLKKEKHPEFSWDLLQAAPARLALASTLNRIHIKDTEEYLEYIRAYKFDDDEFNRAQVVVALGFNGDPTDIDHLTAMADGNNHYVVQSAVTGLALMGGNQARDAMIDLWRKHHENPRGELILDLLGKTYNWRPETQNSETTKMTENDKTAISE